MTLAAGSRLGPYEIVALIGAGGMGEVYRARDLKLNRDVALKILPDVFAADRERLARFRREAQLLASISHPNIGHIYGLDDSGAVHALVLELIAGQTLAERIASGPVPLSDALAIAKQIAEALEVAHEQGIVHRDLKPANIKVTPDGVVKVLDFGLAKGRGPEPGPDLTHSPTITVGGTRDGMVLGTAAYMSPEQARGHAVDKRTDIWAFGCVLYEMLTGRLAFKGDTVSDTIGAILRAEPEWDALPPATPAHVRLLLQRCLDKDSKRRLRDIGDARIELDQPDRRISAAVLESGTQRSASGAVALGVAQESSVRRRAYVAAGLIGLTLVVLAGGASLLYDAKRSPVTVPSEYEQLTNYTDGAVAPSLSPDGRMVTFIRGGESFLSSGQIYVKILPDGESRRLTNDVGSKYGPVFTPDGSRIAFTAIKSIGASLSWDTWTVPVLGDEQPRRLLPNASGLTWMTDGRLLFAEIKGGELHMGIVTATESRADSREIYFPNHERAMAHYAYASPDRQSVLIVEMDQSHAFHQSCRLVPIDGRSAGRPVGPKGTCTAAAWSPDGAWMYFGARVAGSAHLWRQRFPDGMPEQITFGPYEEEGLAVAPDGRSLVSSIGTRRSSIWLHDAAGERAVSSEGYALSPRLSRDGTRLFYLFARDLSLSASGWGPWSAELRSLNLSSGKSDTLLPGISVTDFDISRDEKLVAFSANDGPERTSTIWIASLDRGSPPRQIARDGDAVSFGAEGELIFRSLAENNRLVRIKQDGTGREPIKSPPVLDKFGVSPDGEWTIVFSPGAGGTPGSPGATLAVPTRGGEPRTICAGGDCLATWSSDGRFFYVLNYIANSRSTSLLTRGKSLAIPVPPGKSLPDLPAGGVDLTSQVAIPGAHVIDHDVISPGPDPSTYVFTKTDLQRNLFRIPLH
jgi:serine/threonine protein kinase/Tol biopolymer transport system component